MPSSFAVPRSRRRRTPVASRARSLAAIALLLVAHGAAAAGPPLSLAEALRVAVENSPQLASQRAMVDAAREMAGPAGELPDPKLKLGVENVPTNGADSWSLTRDFMTMSKIGVMQEFPREAKRKLRSQRAENDAQRGDGRRRGGAARRPARDGVGVARALLRRRCRARDRAPDRRGRARGHGRRWRRIVPARRRRASSSPRRAW